MPQGTWSLTDPARTVARRVGSPGARTLLCEVGVSQQEVINHALALVASGRAGTVVVAGSEARAWARDGGVDTDEEDRPPDEVLTRPPDFVAPVEIAAGIVWPPVQQYALIENALAAALHLSSERQREEIAALWARFNAVAAHNPEAAFPQPRDAADIATPGPHNRPLSFPYNRWHSSQWTVDQASALMICSAERARAAGVPPERWLFPHVALHSSEAVTLTARRRLEAVAGHGGARPCRGDAPRPPVARAPPRRGLLLLSGRGTGAATRARARPRRHPHADRGHGLRRWAVQPLRPAIAQPCWAAALRAEPAEQGLLTTVSGMLSKPGLAVWSASPPAGRGEALLADMAAEVIAATEVVPVVEVPPAATTPATVASFTVTYGGDQGFDPVRTAVVADLPDGVRTAATCEDAETARLAVTEGLIGRAVSVKDTTFSL